MNANDLTLLHWLNGFAGHQRWLDELMIAITKYSPFIIAAVPPQRRRRGRADDDPIDANWPEADERSTAASSNPD